MSRPLVLVTLLAAWTPTPLMASEGSWIFRNSYYSHETASDTRAVKFAMEQPAIRYDDPTFERSAYRHTRTGIQSGPGFDFFHVVETWGDGRNLRPYGEWLYPYRAGATQYGPWGNPSGPWTTPFGSWSNPYGLGKLPIPPWSPWYPPAVPLPAPAVPGIPATPTP